VDNSADVEGNEFCVVQSARLNCISNPPNPPGYDAPMESRYR